MRIGKQHSCSVYQDICVSTTVDPEARKDCLYHGVLTLEVDNVYYMVKFSKPFSSSVMCPKLVYNRGVSQCNEGLRIRGIPL
jgi:hypothetical protein